MWRLHPAEVALQRGPARALPLRQARVAGTVPPRRAVAETRSALRGETAAALGRRRLDGSRAVGSKAPAGGRGYRSSGHGRGASLRRRGRARSWSGGRSWRRRRRPGPGRSRRTRRRRRRRHRPRTSGTRRSGLPRRPGSRRLRPRRKRRRTRRGGSRRGRRRRRARPGGCGRGRRGPTAWRRSRCWSARPGSLTGPRRGRRADGGRPGAGRRGRQSGFRGAWPSSRPDRPRRVGRRPGVVERAARAGGLVGRRRIGRGVAG